MKYLTYISITILLCSISLLAHDIQIHGQDGVHIYLNGGFVDVINGNELFLYNLPAGLYTIEAKKRTFDTWRREILLSTEGKSEIFVELIEPAGNSSQFGDSIPATLKSEGGSVLVRSSPDRCQVLFNGKTYDKRRTSLLIEGIKPGKYWIRYNKKGCESLTTLLDIRKNCMIRVTADFIRSVIDLKRECNGDPLRQDHDTRGEKIVVVPQTIPLTALLSDSLINITWNIYNSSKETRHLNTAWASVPYIKFPKDISRVLPPESTSMIGAILYTKEIKGFRGEFPVVFVVDGVNVTSTGFEITR